jgi:hypothetical protein
VGGGGAFPAHAITAMKVNLVKQAMINVLFGVFRIGLIRALRVNFFLKLIPFVPCDPQWCLRPS